MNLIAVIGSATLQIIGLNPQEFAEDGEALWPHTQIFGQGPFYQDTGLGETKLSLKLAARPHLMGGLDAYEALRLHRDRRDVVPFLRLGAGFVAAMEGLVVVKRLKRLETKIAPGDRLGRRHDIECELVLVGDPAQGDGWA